ncbi:MAG: hypothetical protein C5B53_08910 [Candidatus Melainabacteria bacterium]|nr:MAG: hypothetical protein C5B53_08910 [Candidatus Melainabacteria bacterium]
MSEQNETERQPGLTLIDGATGYVGSHLTDYLTRQGLAVRCLTRRGANSSDLAMLKSCQAEIVSADLLQDDGELLKKAFAGVRQAVHLIGSIAPRKGESLSTLHVEQTRKFAQLCREAAVAKVVMVTALGTKQDALSEYHRTKWLAEEELKRSGLNCIIVRPSLLIGRTFGLRDSKLVRRFRELIVKKARVPLIGGGGNRIQPLFIGDLVAAIAKCLLTYRADAFARAPVLELGGGQVLTMREFVQEIMNGLGLQRKFIDVPIPLAHLVAFVAEIAQEVPVVSQDQIRISMVDNICGTNDLTSKLGIEPLSVSEALRSYTRTVGDQAALLEKV